ncbi:MAG: rhomboid family intramembrane serine protease [Gemmatimonadota bacterium]|nr:rhomboid family intramembrane serine protease [Gemmatimonadota bacterium]
MTPWVQRLLIANIAVFALQMFVPGLTQQLELIPVLLPSHPWTIVTYMFLHDPTGFTHILFNMIVLYFFGTRVEERLGSKNFILLYLIAGIGGGVLSFLTPYVAIIGASGALMGIMMAYAKYWPRERIYIYGIIPVEAWLLVTIYVLWDLAGTRGFGGGNTAHFAHLGGFATGFLYLKWMEIRSPARAWKKKVAPSSVVKPSLFGDGETIRRWRDIRLDDLHPINRAEVVRLLQKVDQQGIKSLTIDERATLDRFVSALPQ